MSVRANKYEKAPGHWMWLAMSEFGRSQHDPAVNPSRL